MLFVWGKPPTYTHTYVTYAQAYLQIPFRIQAYVSKGVDQYRDMLASCTSSLWAVSCYVWLVCVCSGVCLCARRQGNSGGGGGGGGGSLIARCRIEIVLLRFFFSSTSPVQITFYHSARVLDNLNDIVPLVNLEGIH